MTMVILAPPALAARWARLDAIRPAPAGRRARSALGAPSSRAGPGEGPLRGAAAGVEVTNGEQPGVRLTKAAAAKSSDQSPLAPQNRWPQRKRFAAEPPRQRRRNDKAIYYWIVESQSFHLFQHDARLT
jgi:hypothetical protein